MRRILFIALIGAAMGCQGTLPAKNDEPSPGSSAVLLRGNFLTPQGEARLGRLTLNLESDTKRYVIKLDSQKTSLYVVNPGDYRLQPARDFSGKPKSLIDVVINGRSYEAPFPTDFLNYGVIRIKPDAVVTIGALEARLADAGTQLTVTLDSRPDTRRRLVQEMIQEMSDPDMPESARNNIVAWSQALQQAMLQIQGSQETRSLPYQAPE